MTNTPDTRNATDFGTRAAPSGGLAAGTRLGQYRIEALLGGGGRGVESCAGACVIGSTQYTVSGVSTAWNVEIHDDRFLVAAHEHALERLVGSALIS